VQVPASFDAQPNYASWLTRTSSGPHLAEVLGTSVASAASHPPGRPPGACGGCALTSAMQPTGRMGGSAARAGPSSGAA